MIPPHNVRAHNKQHALSRHVALSPPLVTLSLLLSIPPLPSYTNVLIFFDLISYAEGVEYMSVAMVLRWCVKHEYGGKGNKKVRVRRKGRCASESGRGAIALPHCHHIIIVDMQAIKQTYTNINNPKQQKTNEQRKKNEERSGVVHRAIEKESKKKRV